MPLPRWTDSSTTPVGVFREPFLLAPVAMLGVSLRFLGGVTTLVDDVVEVDGVARVDPRLLNHFKVGAGCRYIKSWPVMADRKLVIT